MMATPGSGRFHYRIDNRAVLFFIRRRLGRGDEDEKSKATENEATNNN